MFRTQTIKVESYLPLAGLSWLQPPRMSNGEMRGARRGDYSGGLLSDLSEVHPEAVIASSQDLGWQNIRVLHLRHDDREMDLPPLENHCVIVQLEPRLAVNASIGGHSFDQFLSPGEVAIIPAGVPSHWHWHSGRSQETLHLYLHPRFVQQTAETWGLNHGQMAIEPQLGVRDEQLSHLALSLLYELKEENVVGKLYADSVASALAMQLARRYSCLKEVRISKGGMAPHKLRRAIEFISDHLEQEQDVELMLIAEEVGLSYYHFSRAFKQSMGLSPINYLAQQRIERAKRLLSETERPIVEIAVQTGFCSQSHFTASFRRWAGVTPKSFRRGMSF